MRVRQVMTMDVLTVTPDLPLRDAARALVDNRVSGVPVVADGAVVGVLSEGDIVMKASGGSDRGGLLTWLFDPTADGDRAAAQTAGEAMTSPAVTIRPNCQVHEAARTMIERGVNRLPVIENGTLVGIVTRADIVRAFTRADVELAEEIRDDILRRTFWAEPGSVTVAVSNGRVTLAGEVETEADTEMLPLFVSRVPGVVSVSADLRARSSVP
jgi:CBS domain-containing protein